MAAEHVRVRLGSEPYALPVDVVLAVDELEAPTPVPGAPFGVLGVCNRQGQVFPVLDLAALLGIEAGEPPTKLVVAEAGGTHTGLAVNAVTDVAPLSAPTEPARSEHLSGTMLLDGELVGLIDLNSLLVSVAGVPS